MHLLRFSFILLAGVIFYFGSDRLQPPSLNVPHVDASSLQIELTPNSPALPVLIIDGEVVSDPPTWIVQLFRDGNPECAGSLIYPQWVLSAGHCGDFSNQSLKIGGATADSGLPFTIDQSFILSGMGGNQDLALHKLIQPTNIKSVPINRNQQLLHLVIRPQVKAMGYGVQTLEGASDFQLRQTNWQSIYSTNGIGGAFEFGDIGESSSICSGDSGGPVLGKMSADDGENILVGVISYSVEVDGKRCNGKSGAADIAANLDWLDQVIRNNGGPGAEILMTETPRVTRPAVILPTSTPILPTSPPFLTPSYLFLPVALE